MKKLILSLSLILLSSTVKAQSNTVNSGAALPSLCITGSVYITTTTPAFYTCSSPNTWTAFSFIPTGTISLITTGICSSGWTEVTTLNGIMLRGTIAANANVGQTGGNDTITPTVASLSAAAQIFTGSSATSSSISAGTPTGTNSTGTVTPLGNNQALTFIGAAWTPPVLTWPVSVPTNANESAHTHSVTAAGTNGTVSITPLGTNAAITAGTPAGTISALTTGADSSTTGGVAKAIAQTPTFTGSALATHNHTFTGSSTTVGAELFTGSAVTSGVGSAHTHVITWPVTVPTIATYTPTGTINTPTFTGNSSITSAETFTGSALAGHTHTLTAIGTNGSSSVTGTLNSFDNRPAYINVIFCSKN